ncbi:N-acetylglucosamine-6-phosphate deacetylase [Paracoccaceae bacterium]|nr:N-acetylglucosamine-6-phosphate deacetylase [Paracoccaceae bacterium]
MSFTALLGAAIHDGITLQKGKALLCEDDQIIGIKDPEGLPAICKIRHLDGGYLMPGFVDLQVNGGGGGALCSMMTKPFKLLRSSRRPIDDWERILFCQHLSQARSQAAIDAVTAALAKGVPGIAGIHLEGPHLSIARKGAHEPSLIRNMSDADLNMITEAAQRLPNVMLTVAPESVTLAQIHSLAKAGVIISLGHTNADYDTCVGYVAAGARNTTHLFNAMEKLGSRNPGLVGATLDSDNVSAGLIADGVHVHPASMRAALRAKRRSGEIYLVTDAMAAAGSNLSHFTLNGRKVFRRKGTLRLLDGTLAGADIDMPHSIETLIRQVGIDEAKAISMATSIPAKLIKLKGDYGLRNTTIQENLVYMDQDFKLKGLN